ncbi:MAG: Fic family protein [Planctomycetes bacterium]|nr:Fic family protein [Planctomycetota bacterium]
MRTYERSHPWITFRLDLRHSGPRLWMDLGEAASKCEHIAGVPLRPATARELHRLFLAKGALATTAIEGNTLTEGEVLDHLQNKLDLPRSKEYLAQEIDNIVAACRAIGERCLQGDDTLTPKTVAEFNRQVLDKLPLKEGVIPGRLRHDSVVVGNVYRGAPPVDCEHLLERLCTWLNGPDFRAPKGMELAYAVLEAVVAHVYLAWIHPFDDGNGRTARLMEFHILLAAGVPTPAAHLLSNHYNQTRAEYYRLLDQASKSGDDLVPFVEYAVRGFVDGLREQLALIRGQQFDVVWRNYVHEKFHDRNSPHEVRQRHLVLDLSLSPGSVPIARITEVSPRIARAYAGKSTKTLQRDLAALEALELIERTANEVRARREVVSAFLPWRRSGAAK